MTHDGAGLDKHLQAVHDHAAAHRQELRDLAVAEHAQLEAEREAQEADGGTTASPPPAPA
jgi:hypothetical protein